MRPVTPIYDHEIVHVQHIIQHFDVKKCRVIAVWLQEHIRGLEVDKKLFKTTIQQLHLSKRAYNVLHANQINTIGQLIKSSADWDNIRKLRGAGEKVLTELQQKVAQLQAGKPAQP